MKIKGPRTGHSIHSDNHTRKGKSYGNWTLVLLRQSQSWQRAGKEMYKEWNKWAGEWGTVNMPPWMTQQNQQSCEFLLADNSPCPKKAWPDRVLQAEPTTRNEPTAVPQWFYQMVDKQTYYLYPQSSPKNESTKWGKVQT